MPQKNPGRPNQNTYPYQNKAIWTGSEKTIARRVFDAALKRELQDVMQEAKQMASQMKEPADLWDLERYLTERRKEIDRNYNFPVARLTSVFGKLLCERRTTEEELRGLREEKMKAIRSCAKFLSEAAA